MKATRLALLATLGVTVALALAATSAIAGSPPGDACPDACMTPAGAPVVRGNMGAVRPRPCSHACVTRLVATQKVTKWVSHRRFHADPEITVTVGHRSVTPTYYHRHGELCVGYFSGFGTTTRVNVCGKSYKLRITTQSFHQSRKVKVHYKLHYPHGG